MLMKRKNKETVFKTGERNMSRNGWEKKCIAYKKAELNKGIQNEEELQRSELCTESKIGKKAAP